VGTLLLFVGAGHKSRANPFTEIGLCKDDPQGSPRIIRTAHLQSADRPSNRSVILIGKAMVRTKKISTRATHAAAEKPLAGSTVTRSNDQSNTNVELVGTPNECTVQT
jgi:hypothetical protein